jgi:carnitine 3-dehydrogenase
MVIDAICREPEEGRVAQTAIRTVAVIGAGLIGTGWAALFRHAGLAVRVWDPEPDTAGTLARRLPDLDRDLAAAGVPGAPGGSLSVHASLEEAVAGAGFIQENGPERLDVKQEVLAAIDRAAAAHAVIASSSSALRVSDMQRACVRPERVVLGHPFNPSHLMPLVEVAGGEATGADAVALARGFYERLGKRPVVLAREIPGHLALRLMAAMWREAIHLVAEGVATAEDVDRAFMYGPAPKWALQGSFLSNHLGVGDGGMAAFLERFGDTYRKLWDDLGTVRLDRATAERVVAETVRSARGRTAAQLRAERDRGLPEMLKTLNRYASL